MGSSGRTSGITGSPLKVLSFVVTPHTVSRATKNQPRVALLLWSSSPQLFFLYESYRSRGHGPDAAEAIGGHIPHLAGQHDRDRGEIRARGGFPARQSAKPLAGRHPEPALAVGGQ